MDSLIRNSDKLAKHHAGASQKSLNSLAQLISTLEQHTDPAQQQHAIAATTKQITEQLKDLYTNISKYGKLVEKTFKLDLTSIGSTFDHSSVLNESILLHFLREGDFATAQVFAREAQLELPSVRGQFEEMYQRVEEIRRHELTRAIEWAVDHHDRLDSLGIPLEFSLHRLRFLQLIEEGQVTEALAHAREWFPRFSAQSMAEIEHLMGIFIYSRRLPSSPYSPLFTEQRWEDIAHMFASAFCTLLGLSSMSPLTTAVGAGARALPIVCKVSSLLREKRLEWSQQNELPVEVPVPDEMRFHSVFACPVSKEQATEDNPPMMMPCGHVVCQVSLEKLAKGVRPGSIASGRFKCPYCPGLSVLSDAKRVYF